MHTSPFARRLLISCIALVAAFTLPFVGLHSPQAVNAESGCTLKSIKGTWVFQGQGVVIENGNVVPYAEAGMWTLDGKGHATGVLSASINGVPFATREAFTATYTHDAGCAYSAVDAFELTFDLYTTPGSKTMTYFSPGFSGTQFKQ